MPDDNDAGNGTDVPDLTEDIERDLAEARRPPDIPDPTEDLDDE